MQTEPISKITNEQKDQALVFPGKVFEIGIIFTFCYVLQFHEDSNYAT